MRSAILKAWRDLEAFRYEDEECEDQPIWNVRLDAGTNRRDLDQRTYRLRVSPGAIDNLTAESWQMVLDVAKEHDLTIEIDNGAFELTA